MRYLNALALALTVLLLTVLFSQREQSHAAWAELVSASAGENMITFRTKPGEVFRGSWTDVDLSELESLPGVVQVFWSSGYNLSQGASSRYVLPVRTASPGFLTSRGADFLAGRDLASLDTREASIVLSVEQVQVIFGDRAVQEALGKQVSVQRESFKVVGIVMEADAAYLVRVMPEEFGGGYFDVQDVYVQVAETARLSSVLEHLNDYLRDHENLAALEAVSYAEFVRPGVGLERTEFVRELLLLFRWLVLLAVGVAVLNLVNQGLLTAAGNQQRWALHRVVGASRWQLLSRVVFADEWLLWLAVILGSVTGYAMSWLQLGRVSAVPVLFALATGVAALLLGALPVVWQVLRLQPYSSLLRGRGLVRSRWISLSSALGLAAALSLVVLVGGFHDLGKATIMEEIEALGAGLARFIPDRMSLLPVATLNMEDSEAVRTAFPGFPVTLVERTAGEALGNGTNLQVSLVIADEGFLTVSGTRLLQGNWSADSFVLGAAVAEQLFGAGTAIGEPLLVGAARISTLEGRVGAVAAAPSSSRSETLQLPADAVLVPAGMLPNTAIGAILYIDVGVVSTQEQAALAAFLTERRPGAAPFKVQLESQTLRNHADQLAVQAKRFGTVAGIILVLSAVGLVMMALVQALARRYRRGVERAFGASQTQVYHAELRSNVLMLLSITGTAAVIGTLAFRFWTGIAGYAFAMPGAWLVVVFSLAFAIGLPVSLSVAARSAASSPLEVLRSSDA